MQVIAYRANGSTANIERVFCYKDSGATAGTEADPFTGLAFNASGLIVSVIANNGATPIASYTTAGSTIEAVSTLGTHLAPTATKCRLSLVDDTNHPGLVELQFADSLYATASAKYLDICVTGVADLATYHGRIYLDIMDAAGIRTALGLASANIDTQLSTIDTVVDGIAANYATAANVAVPDGKIDDLISGVSTMATIDTVVDAIKAITDQIAFTGGNVDANLVKVAGGTDLKTGGTGSQKHGNS